MRVKTLVAILVAPLGGCQTIGTLNGDRSADGPLTKAEIQRCLDVPHKVGEVAISPTPLPGNVFKPGYNFSVREPDGSIGFGHQQALEGHVIISYPAHKSTNNYEVVRRNGVVYFGKDATSCP